MASPGMPATVAQHAAPLRSCSAIQDASQRAWSIVRKKLARAGIDARAIPSLERNEKTDGQAAGEADVAAGRAGGDEDADGEHELEQGGALCVAEGAAYGIADTPGQHGLHAVGGELAVAARRRQPRRRERVARADETE